MARDRIYINKSYRYGLLEELNRKNILGFNVIGNKDIFLFAVALGLDNPIKIQGKKDGYFLLKDLKMSEKSFFGAIKLGVIKDIKEVEQYAREDYSYDLAEECAESGFAKLKEMYESAADETIFEKRLMAQLDYLYMKNVPKK